MRHAPSVTLGRRLAGPIVLIDSFLISYPFQESTEDCINIINPVFNVDNSPLVGCNQVDIAADGNLHILRSLELLLPGA